MRERPIAAYDALPLPSKLAAIQSEAAAARTQDEYTAAGERAIRLLPQIMQALVVSACPVSDEDDGMCNADNPGNRCICREEFGHKVCGGTVSDEDVDRALSARAVPTAAQAVPNGVWRIAAERRRQIEKGFTPELDRRRPRSTVSSYHDASRALLLSAMSYLSFASARPAVREELRMDGAPDTWPWGRIHWRPGKDDSKASRIRELEKAGALIAAEIDRLLAAAPTGEDE